MTVLENPWIPDFTKDGLFGKQVEFLCYEGREALYGGAAGGGKSVCILAGALQWIEEPGYSALILRRTFKQLSKSDSILNKSKEWLMGRKDSSGRAAKWNSDEKKWTFPNGNTLEFGHMEHEDAKFDYQGGIWPYIGVDECTQFTGPMLAYPRSRQRRPANSRIPIRWRGATNPGGIGHDVIKARYVKDAEGNDPTTPNRQFFPARLDDNPNIDRDEYVATLKDSGIDPLTLAQLLKGDWDAVAGGRFRRDWFGRFHRDGDFLVVDGTGERFRPMDRPRFMTCDPASSINTTADFTVVSTWILTPKGNLLWWRCKRFRSDIPEILPVLQSEYRFAKPMFIGIEEVLSNRAVGQLARRSTDPVMIVRSLSPGGKDKLVRATPAITLAHDGRVFLPDDDHGFPVEDVLSELTRFTGNEKEDAHDDIVDSFAYAAEMLPTLTASARAGLPSSSKGFAAR